MKRAYVGIGALAFGWALAFAGCSSDVTTTTDGGTSDAGTDTAAPLDAGDSAVPDASPPPDAAPDSTPPDAGDAAAPKTFTATLSGAQENPPVFTTATGTATVVLSADRTKVTYTVTHDVAGGSAAHIHLGAGGINGAVVHALAPFSGNMTGTLTISPADATALEQGMWYVNVHSATNPGGELRGQLLAPGSTLWVANLSGAQENPPVASAEVAGAAVILDQAGTSIRYHVTSTLTPTAAHIHKSIGSLNGSVLVPFSTPGTVMDGTATITAADGADLREGRLYVNLHSAANPGGELRGQLMKPGEILYLGRMSGDAENPPVVTAATGGFQLVFDPVTKMARYEAVFTGFTATAAHIHTGDVGVNGPVLLPLTLAAPGAKGVLTFQQADVDALDLGGLYVNAHSTANPGGELRGQLERP